MKWNICGTEIDDVIAKLKYKELGNMDLYEFYTQIHEMYMLLYLDSVPNDGNNRSTNQYVVIEFIEKYSNRIYAFFRNVSRDIEKLNNDETDMDLKKISRRYAHWFEILSEEKKEKLQDIVSKEEYFNESDLNVIYLKKLKKFKLKKYIKIYASFIMNSISKELIQLATNAIKNTVAEAQVDKYKIIRNIIDDLPKISYDFARHDISCIAISKFIRLDNKKVDYYYAFNSMADMQRTSLCISNNEFERKKIFDMTTSPYLSRILNDVFNEISSNPPFSNDMKQVTTNRNIVCIDQHGKRRKLFDYINYLSINGRTNKDFVSWVFNCAERKLFTSFANAFEQIDYSKYDKKIYLLTIESKNQKLSYKSNCGICSRVLIEFEKKQKKEIYILTNGSYSRIQKNVFGAEEGKLNKLNNQYMGKW